MSMTMLKGDQVKSKLDESNTFDGQVVVVKFGGNSIGNEAVCDALIADAVTLIKKGVRVVVVHGGGTAVNEALAAIGKTTEKVNGLRVTDAETLEIAVKTFMEINEELVKKFQEQGAQPLSFCAKSANPIVCEKMALEDKDGIPIDLGWVGKVTDVESGSLESWLWAGWTPIISPIAIGADGHYFNINADHAALAIATQLQADGLFFLTDVPGVLNDVADPQSKIHHLTPLAVQSYIDEGTISGGMLPKIKSCVAGIKGGVGQIAILNSFEPNALVNGFLDPKAAGTLITGDA